MSIATTLRTCGIILLTAVSAFGSRPARADDRPNVLFCIADDWSWPHAGAYGDKVVKTPTFDRIAREGALFNNAFCAAPSCSPSRAAILTGQAPHRLESGANLWGTLPAKFAVYPDLLEANGYAVGLQGKGWGPGGLGERTRNPAGPPFKSFEQFLKSVPEGKPFCFWYGSSDPHRPYVKGSGIEAGMKPEDVIVPPGLPDTPEVRSDILGYYAEVQRFDQSVGEMLELLEQAGRLDNTLVVVTSDNGMPFPRGKATLYDFGAHMPLAVRWPARMQGGQTLDGFVSLSDLAPTFLEAAGLKPLPEMTGQSLLGLLTGREAQRRDAAFTERERHANVRKGDLSYPARAIRTADFLYIRNLAPDRWPAGDPETWKAVGPFGDIDGGPSKDVVIEGRDDPAIAPFFERAMGKRPAEELYDLKREPRQIHNVADDPQYADAKRDLRASLDRWMEETNDPRAKAGGEYDAFDRYPYFGGGPDSERMNQPNTRPANRRRNVDGGRRAGSRGGAARQSEGPASRE